MFCYCIIITAFVKHTLWENVLYSLGYIVVCLIIGYISCKKKLSFNDILTVRCKSLSNKKINLQVHTHNMEIALQKFFMGLEPCNTKTMINITYELEPVFDEPPL